MYGWSLGAEQEVIGEGGLPFLINIIMKKGLNLTSDKNTDSKTVIKSLSQIKFNLSAHNLACFQGKDHTPHNKSKLDLTKQPKFLSQLKAPNTARTLSQQIPLLRNRAISCINNFNESVVIMQYDNIDVYIDNSTRKKSGSKGSKPSPRNANKEESGDSQDQFLESCVRAATEETDNSSNTVSLSANHMTPSCLTSRQEQFGVFYDIYDGFYQPIANKVIRNRHSVTNQESKRFIIDYENIIEDGRTTVMVKNIPNKYTQQMLLEQFARNYENKFDFFYLPIDKDNDCNVGYAFVNFLNAAYLKDFYSEFHQQKWKRYKSPKICSICYARYQGTLQLADHFKHTKIINQKDRKVKPLMGISEANKIRDIKKMIKNQRNQEVKQQ